MYINKYFGMALLGVMVCILGVLVFLLINDNPLPAQAQKSSQSNLQMTRFQITSGSDGIAVLDTSGKLVVYRVFNSNKLVPVSGRVIRYDFEILDKKSSMYYFGIGSGDKNYEPGNLKKAIEKSGK